MPTIVPNAEYLDGETPTIFLAGKLWPVPIFGPKQNRHIVPAIMRILPRFASIANVDMGTTDEEQKKLNNKLILETVQQIDEATYDDLITIVYWALKKTLPVLTRDDFEELPIGTNDLLAAVFPVIANQTGMMKQKHDLGGIEPKGEVLGNHQIGTN